MTFLLSYKLTDYAADFNTVRHKSRIEIIFLMIFFIFLFVPMSNVSKKNYSEMEHRIFAGWKPLLNNNGSLNFNFGRDYTNWFNDRFFLRQFFLDAQINILMHITDKMPRGRLDKDDYVWADHEMKYNLEKINNADYKALIKFDKYCKDHNIELYVLLVPIRKYIYPPSKPIYIKDEYANNIYKNVSELNQKYDLHIINPIKELQAESKNNYMYYKTDHHWTFDGAYVGYRELMKEINKKHKDIYALQEDDFTYYENCLVMADYERVFRYGGLTGFSLPRNYVKKLHRTNYRYYTHKNAKELKMQKKLSPYQHNKLFYYPYGADYRVIVMGSSVIENLDEFVPYTFKNILHMRINGIKKIPEAVEYKIMKYHEKEILNYKPDIIIFCIAYNNMYKLNDIFNRK